MAEIIQFPLNFEREWIHIEKGLRKGLQKAQLPDEVIDQILVWTKVVWPKYKEKFDFRSDWILKCMASQSAAKSCNQEITRVLDEIKDHFKSFGQEMFFEMTSLKVEFEMYKYRHSPSPDA